MKTVLLVDDEPEIVALCRDYLEAAGYAVIEAGDGSRALELIAEHRPDLVVLDLGLPLVTGLDVTRRVRRESAVPIVMLTARGEESDKLIGLELGADDYLTKPFSPKELVARIGAVLRRTEGSHQNAELLRAHGVEVDLARMSVTVEGERVELTPTEFRLLATLIGQPGRVFTRAQLLNAVQGVSFESYERAIDAHVKNVRRKIEPEPRAPRYIETVFGVGYRFAEPAPE